MKNEWEILHFIALPELRSMGLDIKLPLAYVITKILGKYHFTNLFTSTAKNVLRL